MYALDFAGKGMIIYFGVLHCLGICMLLWPIFKHIPWSITVLLSVTMAVIGILIDPFRFDCSIWLIPLGFKPKGFISSVSCPVSVWETRLSSSSGLWLLFIKSYGYL
jgi:uncharacterized membrane protein